MAYVLTKPFRLYNSFNGKGVYRFILQEVSTTDNDNHELGIADYYKYYSKNEEKENIHNSQSPSKKSRKKVWL